MQKGYKKKIFKKIIIGLDFLLLVSFLAQALIIGCMIAYGYIPVSAQWANKQLSKRQFDGFYIQADSFRLKLSQTIELVGLKIYHSGTEDPILTATSTEVYYSLGKSGTGSLKFDLAKLVVTEGTLLMPAIYAPDGKRTRVLRDVTFHLSPTENCIKINSFAGKHKDIYLRGSVEWPITSSKPSSPKASIRRFYKLIASALKEKAKISPLIEPTLEFALSTRYDNSIDVSLVLSCERLKHSQIVGNYFSLSTDFVLSEGQLNARAPLILRARDITFDDLDVFAEDITAHIKTDRWPELFKGTLPKFEVSTYRLKVSKVELNAPRIMIEPAAFPILQFSGTTCGLKGNAVYSGAFNSNDKSGTIHARGSIDIFNLLPDPLVKKLPALKFAAMPFYNLSIDFNKDFEISNANFHVACKDLKANELHFDKVVADGYYRKNELYLRTIHIDRKKQWVDGSFHLDGQTKDFKLYLLGSVIPKQYNSLLPKWWSNIFQDFHFNSESPARGDFSIYGKTEKGGKTSFFGHVEATNLAYKKAFFDTCDLIARGHQNYVEIHNINAQVGSNRATGSLGFTSAKQPRKGLISVRYKFDASLPIETASNALGGNVASILKDFKLTGLPDAQIDGIFFNETFEEYAGQSRINIHASVETPLEFKGTPLDHMQFRLIGQDRNTYLRDVQFGYADGTAEAEIDILPSSDETSEMCFKLSLKDANQAKAIQNLPKADTNEGPSNASKKEKKDPARISGLLDLNLHAKGPLADIYGFQGYGNINVRNKAFGRIRLLGPLSKLLKNSLFSFTSFDLDRMDAFFEVDREQIVITDLKINGPRTRIWAEGTLQLPDQALDMDVKVSLFANTGDSESTINAIGRAIASPLPNLLSFKLTGTVHDQKVRSKFDPRNLIR